MPRYILLDIEGTTTDIHFVHQVLFPYSTERLPEYIQAHLQDATVQHCLNRVKETIQDEEHRAINNDDTIQTLLHWIQTDRKHAALKELQGFIWKIGYEQGDYQGHIYPDVPVALKRWQEHGIGLGIYSSGSVQAQKLIFGYSVFGDLTPYFSNYFDTQVGGKKEVESYRKIVQNLNLAPSDILFLSDVVAELDAAKEAGFQVTQLLREPNMQVGSHPTVKDFLAL